MVKCVNHSEHYAWFMAKNNGSRYATEMVIVTSPSLLKDADIRMLVSINTLNYCFYRVIV